MRVGFRASFLEVQICKYKPLFVTNECCEWLLFAYEFDFRRLHISDLTFLRATNILST